MSEFVRNYLTQKFPYRHAHQYTSVNVDYPLLRRIALAYEKSHHSPDDDEVIESYLAFKQEIVVQFEYMLAEGIKITPWLPSGQPYNSSRDLLRQVAESNRLHVFLTKNGYGEQEQLSVLSHPMLEETDYVINGQRLCYNDVFRAVHDYVGHYLYQLDFSVLGECQTAFRHMETLSEAASKAVFSETAGQICFFYYGSHLYDSELSCPSKGNSGYVPLSLRPYAEQKATVLPAILRQLFAKMFK